MSLIDIAIGIVIILALLPVDVGFITSITRDYSQEYAKSLRIEEYRDYKSIEDSIRDTSGDSTEEDYLKIGYTGITKPLDTLDDLGNPNRVKDLENLNNKKEISEQPENIVVDGSSVSKSSLIVIQDNMAGTENFKTMDKNVWVKDRYVENDKMLKGEITDNSSDLSLSQGVDYVEIDDKNRKSEKEINNIDYYKHLETDMTRKLVEYLNGQGQKIVTTGDLPELKGTIDIENGKLTFISTNPTIVFTENDVMMLCIVDKIEYKPTMELTYSIYEVKYDSTFKKDSLEHTFPIIRAIRLKYK